jgi:hypothetical protein
MSNTNKLTLGVAIIALLGAADASGQSMGANNNSEPILDIKTAGIEVLKTGPRFYQVNVDGDASTPGWSMQELRPVPSISPPHSGIFEFAFVATPPGGVVIQLVTPISIKANPWHGSAPPNFRGVRIDSKTNCIIALLPGVDKTKVDAGKCLLQ